MLSLKEKKHLQTLIIETVGGNKAVNELKNYSISRSGLIDWFVEYQKSKPLFCNCITVRELIETAQDAGIKVNNYITKERLITDKPLEKWNSEITKEMLEYLYLEKGLTPAKIADSYNITAPNVNYLLEKYGLLKIKTYNTRNKPSKEQIERIYSQYSTREICQRLRISSRTLYNLIKEYGIKKKNKERKAS